jgi:hypothetical protein
MAAATENSCARALDQVLRSHRDESVRRRGLELEARKQKPAIDVTGTPRSDKGDPDPDLN